MKRFKMNRHKSRKVFSKTADLIHKKNQLQTGGYVMRGGIRL